MTSNGLRSHRVAGTAVVDWVASLVAGWAIGRWVVGVRDRPHAWAMWYAFWVLLGVFVHKLLGIETALARTLRV